MDQESKFSTKPGLRLMMMHVELITEIAKSNSKL